MKATDEDDKGIVMPVDKASISTMEVALEETAQILLAKMQHEVMEKFRRCNWSYRAADWSEDGEALKLAGAMCNAMESVRADIPTGVHKRINIAMSVMVNMIRDMAMDQEYPWLEGSMESTPEAVWQMVHSAAKMSKKAKPWTMVTSVERLKAVMYEMLITGKQRVSVLGVDMSGWGGEAINKTKNIGAPIPLGKRPG